MTRTVDHRHFIQLMWLLTLNVLSVLAALPASAHELRPAVFTLTVGDNGHYSLEAKVNLEARLAGIGTQHGDTDNSPKAAAYNELRQRSPDSLRNIALTRGRELSGDVSLRLDGRTLPLALTGIDIPDAPDTGVARTSRLHFVGEDSRKADSMTWQAAAAYGDTVLRVVRPGEQQPIYASLLKPAQATPAIAVASPQSDSAGFLEYVMIGFEHIVPKGLDHILFVVGLFLLSPYLRPLLWQVTGFTLAHSATLALAILGVVSVPASIVEPLIAASIGFIAVENLFTDRLHRWRPFVVFGFGLLHGLGFAGVLSEIGLPDGQFVPALLAFNIGVELGQLAVLAVCFLGVGLWLRQRNWYRKAVALPASSALAVIAMVWFAERISII